MRRAYAASLSASRRHPIETEAVKAGIAKLWQTREIRKVGKTCGLVRNVWFVPAA